MMSERTYFDFNATAPLRDEAREAVLRAFNETGNASSVHSEGRQARAKLEQAREQVAELVNVSADCVTFTSGGTEANHLAFAQAAPRGASTILYSAIEHPSVMEAAKSAGADASIPTRQIPVDQNGLLDVEALTEILKTTGGRPFVSVMAANNETGVIQPLAQISEVVKNAGGIVHTDAIQIVGKCLFDLSATGVDMATVSAHKLGGPQGVGAFVLSKDAAVTARQTGGGQERGRRSGTENVSGIAGFGAASVAATEEVTNGVSSKLKMLRDGLEAKLLASGLDVSIFGTEAPRLPNTTCFSAPGLKAETLLMQLDLAGFAVSAGSACSSGKVARSHVLEAMNIDANLAAGAVRVSLGSSSTQAQVNSFADAWISAAQKTKHVVGRGPALVAAEG
jgi:cysteine desulfurase